MSLDVEALYAQHARLVRWYVAGRMSGADADADAIEDMTSDVWERAVRAAPSFQERGATTTWLLRIAHNLIVDRYRARHLRATIRLTGVAAYVTDAGTSEHIDRIDAQVTVSAALASFRIGNSFYSPSPDRQLAVIRARYFEGGTDADVGRRLGMTEQVVKSLRRRALANLRKAVEAA